MWFLYWNPDSLENLECLLFLLTDCNWYIDRLHSWYGGLVIEKRFFRGEWYFIALDHYFLCSFFWIKKYCLINSQLRSLVFVVFNFNWPHPFMCPGKISNSYSKRFLTSSWFQFHCFSCLCRYLSLCQRRGQYEHFVDKELLVWLQGLPAWMALEGQVENWMKNCFSEAVRTY